MKLIVCKRQNVTLLRILIIIIIIIIMIIIITFYQSKSVSLSCYKWVPWETKKLTIKGKNNYNGSLSEKCKNYVQC